MVAFYQYLDRVNRRDILTNGNAVILWFAMLQFMGWWLLFRLRDLSADAAENDYHSPESFLKRR